MCSTGAHPKRCLKFILPFPQVIVLSTPAPVRVWEAIHQVELLRRHGRNPTKVTFVSESGKSVAKSAECLLNIKQEL